MNGAIDTAVTDNPAHQRYELDIAGQTAFINYRRHAGVVTMTHAEVPAELNGRGIGSTLVRGALEIVRIQGEQVVPVCPFIAIYIQRHPEYAGLLAR